MSTANGHARKSFLSQKQTLQVAAALQSRRDEIVDGRLSPEKAAGELSKSFEFPINETNIRRLLGNLSISVPRQKRQDNGQPKAPSAAMVTLARIERKIDAMIQQLGVKFDEAGPQ